MIRQGLIAIALLTWAGLAHAGGEPRGTGDLGIVIERASGRVHVVDTSAVTSLCAVDGLGDLSHASAVFSRDGRFAFVFGRDGGLTKVDLLTCSLAKRVVQGGNAIGGAISQDGRWIAVSNYEPGGVKVFAAEDLALIADLPALSDGVPSKVVGLIDIPGNGFAFALYDAGEIRVADLSQDPRRPRVRTYDKIGRLPYDGIGLDNGRYYLVGLFGEDGLALLDLWHPEAGVKRILDGYGKGEEPLPVYKMPHLEGVAIAGDLMFLPAVGRHELLVVEPRTWREMARIPLQGQPVFAVARPDGRQIWVNFAHPTNDVVQIVDVPTLKVIETLRPGRAVMHLEFTPRGDQVWISARDDDQVVIYDPRTSRLIGCLAAEKPSGILFAARAQRIGY